MVQLIRFFSENDCEVHFASTAAKTEKSAPMEPFGVSAHSIKLNDPDFNCWIHKLKPDFVVFDRFVTEEQFSWRVKENCDAAVRILDSEDLHMLREARRLALKHGSDELNSFLLNDISLRELASIYRSDMTLVISEHEIKLLKEHYGVDGSLLHYLPFLLHDDEIPEADTWRSFEKREGFMTMGNWLHGPNRDSVYFLKEEVWPLVRKRMPEARIHIYGAYAGDRDLRLHDPYEGFLIKGWAESKAEAFSRHRVCLAPLRYGAGLKGKLIDAMRYGIPSVTTVTGTEGISGQFPWPGFVSEDAADIANSACELYSNMDLWEDCQRRGRRILSERFLEESFRQKLLFRLEELRSRLIAHRAKNIVGALLWHHSAQSTKYLSKWIEAKNQNRES